MTRPEDIELTADEKRAIAAFKRLAKRWPETLWVFAGGQSGLAVLRTDERGEHVHTRDGNVDPDYVVDYVNINADGGDW